MSSEEGMQIPEDLKMRYEHSKTWLERNQGRVCPEAHDNFIRIELIERIARLEAQNAKLIEALEELQNDHCNYECERCPDHTALCIKARAALAKKEAV